MQSDAFENLLRTTCHDIITRAKASTGTDRFKNKTRPGIKPKLTVQAERKLVRYAITDTRACLAALATPSKSRKQLFRKLVRKTLKKYNKARRRARRKPWLKLAHKKKKMVFGKAEKKRNWDLVI